jgi:hypothetical protein
MLEQLDGSCPEHASNWLLEMQHVRAAQANNAENM